MRRLALLLAALAALAAPARATQDAWPALFDVTGVAEGDVLNVRAGPSAASPVIGALARDARRVEVIEPDPRQGWGLVNAGAATGWVSLAFLRRLPGQWSGAHPPLRRCFGTEPFWSLALDDAGGALWSEPGTDGVGGAVSARWGSENRRDKHAFSVRLAPSAETLPAEAIGTVSVAACSDGMSDRRYGLAVDLLVGNLAGARLLSGCCSLAD